MENKFINSPDIYEMHIMYQLLFLILGVHQWTRVKQIVLVRIYSMEAIQIRSNACDE